MKKRLGILLAVPFVTAVLFGQAARTIPPKKAAVARSVEAHAKELAGLSDRIWAFAETAMKETRSSKALADYAESRGFRVERGVADMPTAFVASYGSGRPIIGVLGEYDALPGLSQKAIPEKAPIEEGAPGHGCGHNLFGAGSMGAAVAIKELIERGELHGTVRFYGTPAEEDIGGKLYMARAGLFDDLDACLDWHPDTEIKASTQSSQAVYDYTIEFFGKTAHAAFDPWNGRSALDGLESFADGINLLREHVRPTVRIHYVFQKTGLVPNVVPDDASVWLWIRDSKREGVERVAERMKNIAKGAALIAGVDYNVRLNSGIYEVLVNRTGATALQQNLELLGPITYTPAEEEFAKKIQKATGVEPTGLRGAPDPLEATKEDPPGGSTDVGDVSWIVPEISLVVTTAPEKAPWHSWAVVACGGMSIGHKGMLYAAKALGMTMVDLFEKKDLREAMRKEFLERKGNQVYKAMIPDGPPPAPSVKNQ